MVELLKPRRSRIAELVTLGITVSGFKVFRSRVRPVEEKAVILIYYDDDSLVDDESDNPARNLSLIVDIVKTGIDESVLEADVDNACLLIANQINNNQTLAQKIHYSKLVSTDFSFDGGENNKNPVLSAKMSWDFLYTDVVEVVGQTGLKTINLLTIQLGIEVLPSVLVLFPVEISLPIIRLGIKALPSELVLFPVEIDLSPINMGIRAFPSNIIISSPVSPLDMSGLGAYWDGSKVPTISGLKVQKWADQSVNKNHVTQDISSRQPFYDTTTDTHFGYRQ